MAELNNIQDLEEQERLKNMIVIGPTGPKSNLRYIGFTGIFNCVDEGNYFALQVHRDLAESLQATQRSVSLLYLAILRKNYSIAKFLLELGCDPNFSCLGICTCLHVAIFYHQEDIARLLIEFGADPNVPSTSRNIYPLHLSAAKGFVHLAQELIEAGADPNCFSNFVGTPMHVALSKNHLRIGKLFLENGAALNIAHNGETCLHVATRASLEALNLVLTKKKELNAFAKDYEGNTALHLACINSREKEALLLIQYFPDLVHIRNHSDRQTPLYYSSAGIRRSIKGSFKNQFPGFKYAVNSPDFADVIFLVSGKTMFGHQAILQFRWPEFRKLPQDQKGNKYIVSGIDSGVFLVILKYLYTDALHCDHELQKVLKAAEQLNMYRLKALIQDRVSPPVLIPDSTFQKDMEKSFHSKEFADVTVVVEETEFACSKVILCRHTYFRAMFSSRNALKESQSSAVVLHDMEKTVFETIKFYAYTFQFPQDLDINVALNVLQATDRLLIDGLVHSCEDYLTHFLNMDTAIPLFQIAHDCKALFLKEECFGFIFVNYAALAQTEHFLQMSPELAKEIEEYVQFTAQRKNAPRGSAAHDSDQSNCNNQNQAPVKKIIL